MAVGCASGIQNAEVRAANGAPSFLFQGLVSFYKGDLDMAYKAYLRSQTKRFGDKLPDVARDRNGEFFIKDIAELIQENQTVEYFSKPLDDEATAPKTEPDSVMSRILAAAKLIIDPEVDTEGNQADTYGYTNTPGGAAIGFLGRVSNLIGEFSMRKTDLKDKSGKIHATLTEAIVHREAQMFDGKGVDEKLEVNGIFYTREAFMDFKRGIYKQGQVKGDLIHALIQRQIAYTNNNTSLYDALSIKIQNLTAESTSKDDAYNWVVDEKNFEAIMANAGIVISPKVPIALRDVVHSEVAVGDIDMGFAGKIDTLVEKPSGLLKVIDYKTGNRFNDDKLSARIMNYGAQEYGLYDTGMGRAKLQTVLYSMLIKASNPDARFEPPVIMHIPDESRATSPRNAHQVEVRDYLKMIEQYYRNENPVAYAALLAKSPDIFNPSHYGASLNTSFTQDILDDKTGMRDDEKLKQYEAELEVLVTGVALRKSEEGDDWYPQEKARRKVLIDKILQARTTLALPKGTTENYELKKFTKWLGTINDTHNPYIQAYAQVVAQARMKVYEEYGAMESQFNSLMSKVVEEKLGKRSGLNVALKPVDTANIFKSMINDSTEIDKDGNEEIKRGMVSEKDAKWATLTANEKALVIFMRENMQDVFQHVMVDGPNAIVSHKFGKPMTKLDIYNENIGAGFKMTDAFIPKMGITSSEVNWRAKHKGWEGIKERIKHETAKRLSMFYEENVEGMNQKQFGIPVKFLGSGSTIHNLETNSSNLELAFKGYMQHMINKKHYDTVYAIGDGIRGYMAAARDTNGNKINENAAEFIEYHMQRNLIGRLNDQGQGFWRKGFTMAKMSDGREIKFSPIKLMKTLNSVTAAVALWLKLPSAAKNAGQALWAVSKVSFVNSISAMEWAGIDASRQDLSGKNHMKAHKAWASYQKACLVGKGDQHPVHVFIKSFKMYPDMTELGTHRTKMITDGGTLWNNKHLTLLYGYPEEMTTAVLGMDAMMTMKIKSGTYAGKSMWDVYSENIVVDPISGEGRYELPADFSRGKLRMGDGSLQELKGLNPIEVQKIHTLIQNVKGGYRMEERSMIESTVLGEMFMLFKRWLPAAIVQGFQGKKYSTANGVLELTEQKDGEDIYDWKARMTEGRWRTLAGFLINAGGSAIGKDQKSGYNWADMSDLQKRNVIDGAYTFAVWSMMAALTGLAFADADDEDSLKKWSSEMNMRLIEQWNFIDMLNTAVSPPAAIQKAVELLKGVQELSMASAAMAVGGDDSDVFTRRGDLKGLNKVLKNLPVTAAWYDAERFLSNTDYWEQ